MEVYIYNHLQTEIKSMFNGTKSFKCKLTILLLENSSYTIKEFFWTEVQLERRLHNNFITKLSIMTIRVIEYVCPVADICACLTFWT
jgi:hypothetical protein